MYLLIWVLVITLAVEIWASPHHNGHDKFLEEKFIPTEVVFKDAKVVEPRQIYSSLGFGGRTESTGYGIAYKGNVGDPYGSNIIKLPTRDSSNYKYIAEFKAATAEVWNVVIWNKFSPDGKLGGWFGHGCLEFTLDNGQTQRVAFDEDSQGGWAAAPGYTIPTDNTGGYASTWGEFDFGSTINSGWSGFDVSAIVAQAGNMHVQGMKICDTISGACSSIAPNATQVTNAYTLKDKEVDGIGGNLPAGPVSLVVVLGYPGEEARA